MFNSGKMKAQDLFLVRKWRSGLPLLRSIQFRLRTLTSMVKEFLTGSLDYESLFVVSILLTMKGIFVINM